MKRYGNLFERIVDIKNLYFVVKKSFHGKKFKQTAAAFYFNLENEILKMQREILDESCYPSSYRIFTIYEPKERKICCAEFYD